MIRPFIAAAAMVAMLAGPAVADVLVCPLEEAMKRLEDYNIHFNESSRRSRSRS